jgi:hypothetical protein
VAILGSIGTAASFAKTVWEYFSPSKSPFYATIVAGSVAMVLSCEKISGNRWYQVDIPIFIVLAVSLLLSRENKALPAEQKDQLTFARSLCISSAVLTLVFAGGDVGEPPLAFHMNYWTCLIQIIVFVIYVWARNRAQLEESDFNFLQLALITTTFLVTGGWAITYYAKNAKDLSLARQYLIVAFGLYGLWFICTCFWIRHLGRLIKVQRPGGGVPSPDGEK